MKIDAKALNEAIEDLQAQRIQAELREFLITAPRDIGLIYKLYVDKAQRRAERRRQLILAAVSFLAAYAVWYVLVGVLA